MNRDSRQENLLPAEKSKRPAASVTITLGLSLAVLIGCGSVANDMFPFSGVFITIMTKLASSGLGFVMIAVVVGWFSKSWKIAASVASVSILFALASITVQYRSTTCVQAQLAATLHRSPSVSYTHLTLPTIAAECRSRWSPYH